jgi:hypothetical protein
LVAVNREIPLRETDGGSKTSKEFFANLLAPHFAFRRARGTVDGREEYLASLASAEPREQEGEAVVKLLGESRAFVTCIVRMTAANSVRRFHNARIFIRTDDGWKLLAWANEEL